MYAEHQPQLSSLGRSGPDGFARICTFALLSIRQPLYDVVGDYPIVRRGDRNVRSVWGKKHGGLSYIARNSTDLYERCEHAYELLDDDDAENVILPILCEIPCIGAAKAGFIAQMVYGLSGCIDGHNLARFDLPEAFFRLRKDSWKAARQRAFLRDYNRFCRKVGGAQRLWDDWCRYVSEKDPINYRTPDYVSELHLTPLAV